MSDRTAQQFQVLILVVMDDALALEKAEVVASQYGS